MVDKSSKTITVYEVLSAGFVKVPVNGVTSFQPELRDTKTVYITIICFDNLGDQKIIATNLPHGPSHSVIITKGGGVVDAADGMKWTDKNGIYHKVNCLVCLGVKSNCTACVMDTRMEQIKTSLKVVQGCQISQGLLTTIEKMSREKMAKKEQEGREMMTDIEALAKEYWTLESKTKRTVREIHSYAKRVHQAALDYKEDGCYEDFLVETADIEVGTR